mmetsp:Transcript_28101/g.45560  ORF Transcript_28101/g.45560 Transcript_28101/m.45560 type:complete len:291 (-) Transcript_28101:361-1233(-)
MQASQLREDVNRARVEAEAAVHREAELKQALQSATEKREAEAAEGQRSLVALQAELASYKVVKVPKDDKAMQTDADEEMVRVRKRCEELEELNAAGRHEEHHRMLALEQRHLEELHDYERRERALSDAKTKAEAALCESVASLEALKESAAACLSESTPNPNLALLQRELAEALANNRILQGETFAAKEAHRVALEEIAGLGAKLGAATAEVNEIRSQSASIRNFSAQSKVEAAAYERQLKAYKAEISRLEAENNELRRQLEALEAKLEQALAAVSFRGKRRESRIGGFM